MTDHELIKRLLFLAIYRELRELKAAALAQPEPLTDKGVAKLVAALKNDAECVEVEHYDLCSMTAEQMRRAADLLERLAQPEPQGPTDEELKAAYWEAFKDAAPCGAEESWLEGLRAVARWGRPAIEPMPQQEVN